MFIHENILNEQITEELISRLNYQFNSINNIVFKTNF